MREPNEEEKKRALVVAKSLFADEQEYELEFAQAKVAAVLATYGDDRAREARKAALDEAQAICARYWDSRTDAAVKAEGRTDDEWENTNNEHTHHAWAAENLEYQIRALATQEPAPPKPANQCDGCARGLSVEDGLHVEYLDGGKRVVTQACTADRYKEPGR